MILSYEMVFNEQLIRTNLYLKGVSESFPKVPKEETERRLSSTLKGFSF